MHRLIRLRRPANLSIIDTPFVPMVAASVLEEAERRWTALREANPEYYDGRVYQVLGVHRNGHGGAVLHLVECAYRYFAVQSPAFDLGVRTLGTKGITWHDGDILFGRRTDRVAAYRRQWECAPAGVADVGLEPAETLRNELHEETGLEPAADPVPVALIYDDVIRTWELVFRIEAAARTAPPGAVVTGEYDELTWREPADPPGPLTPIAARMLELIGSD